MVPNRLILLTPSKRLHLAMLSVGFASGPGDPKFNARLVSNCEHAGDCR
ncbi:hypothetical protein AGR7C_pTi0023 [Agrobacterium deltaense Zutra 3/1]|uniref:Uncharacterized protein n=1 Tax=Agrobacterium deltaense Zutra 3/1 TaxID=1183427 RepID=A0A1S7S4W6_9HYPH|nr:hypothetical protein AGR7C_pTi0023 [Agrobacterium deltaense Zutra 3/1]